MMADRKRHIKTDSCKRGSGKKRRFPHLKPLSVYSRMVYSKATDSYSDNLSWRPDCASWNVKVELSNNRASVRRKRQLDDSCLDETHDTPLKKPRLAQRSPPDSACVLDSSNSFQQVKLVSSHSSSVALNGIKRIEKTLLDQKSLGLDWIDGSNKTTGQSSAIMTDVHASSPVTVHNKVGVDVIAFDYDMDEIMCLSPIDSADVGADGLEDFVQSCQTSYEEQLPVSHGSWSSSKQKRECSLGKDAQTASDEGYVTKSYCAADPGESKVMTESEEMYFIKSYKITVPNFSNDQTRPVSIPIMSTPLAKFRELVKGSPLLRPNPDLDKENWSCEHVKTSSASSPSAYVNLEADTAEALPTIPFLNDNEGNVVLEGMAILKSLVCHSRETRTATREKEDDHVLSASPRQADSAIQGMSGEETDTADSFESTLPLHVQVKSKVVLPNTQQREAVKTAARRQTEKKTTSEGQRNVFKDIPRPVVLYREEDWEKEKTTYVNSVKRHMADNSEDGVMTELLHLMNVVANQGRGSDGRKWQHPSDLTRRNYRLRNSGRLLSLDEWQNLNYRNHRRFEKVPQTFKRSPVL